MKIIISYFKTNAFNDIPEKLTNKVDKQFVIKQVANKMSGVLLF
jgi:hypothetical protein